MNIYLHVEIASRELDSKLLLAVVAASRGHTVIVSELNAIIRGFHTRALGPGIFHTKSLTPSEMKIARHQTIVDGGGRITSIDEESGLTDHNHEAFARARYSDASIAQASAVFAWGAEDSETLKRIYPNFSSKIHETGSPRVDLWRKQLSQYWVPPRKIPKKPFLLVSSNMGAANNMRPLFQNISFEKKAGYYQRNPNILSNAFGVIADDFRMTYSFVEAIQHLAASNNGYDIVLRPHPVENVEAWKVYLDGIPNVHIIREGSITAWLSHAFALMHNGCTTAMEASISSKPVVTYLPFERERHYLDGDIPNKLGERVESLEALSETINRLFNSSGSSLDDKKDTKPSEFITKKVYLDSEELAAEKIVNVWETFDSKKLSSTCNWWKFQGQLLLASGRNFMGTTLRRVFPQKFGFSQENYKFPPMNAADIQDRVSRLQQTLKLSEPLECKLLSKRTVLIRPKLQ